MQELLKNTVKVENQLDELSYIKFESIHENPDFKVMFVGNSITLHGVKPEIGWHGLWGMAASQKENDYVHVCMREMLKTGKNISFCICQVWEWEKDYTEGEKKLVLYEKARAFDADIIIMRAVENCSPKTYEKENFKKQYAELLDFLGNGGKAKIILTTSFWKHPADEAIEEYSTEKGYPLCVLSDLGELPEMKAIGKFEHRGVANHPGDLGMKTIADRIMNVIRSEKYFG